MMVKTMKVSAARMQISTVDLSPAFIPEDYPAGWVLDVVEAHKKVWAGKRCGEGRVRCGKGRVRCWEGGQVLYAPWAYETDGEGRGRVW